MKTKDEVDTNENSKAEGMEEEECRSDSEKVDQETALSLLEDWEKSQEDLLEDLEKSQEEKP